MSTKINDKLVSRILRNYAGHIPIPRGGIQYLEGLLGSYRTYGSLGEVDKDIVYDLARKHKIDLEFAAIAYLQFDKDIYRTNRRLALCIKYKMYGG